MNTHHELLVFTIDKSIDTKFDKNTDTNVSNSDKSFSKKHDNLIAISIKILINSVKNLVAFL